MLNSRKFVFILKSKNMERFNPELLKAHVEHLRRLVSSESLLTCGPFRDENQALQIIKADCKESAIKLFKTDPFISQKYYQDFEVHELLEADESNNWLMN